MSNQVKTTDTLNLIYCDVDRETYALDMSWVRSIQRIDRLLTRPDLEIGASGFVGWLPGSQGDIPVFHLASRLGRSPASGETEAHQRIIVLPSPAPFTNGRVDEGQPWGLLVDRISQVIQAPADRFEPLPPIVIDPATNYFEGVIKTEEGLILFLSPEWLHPDAPPNPARSQPQSYQHEGEANFTPKKSERTGQASRRGRLMIFSAAQPGPEERQLSFGLSIMQIPEIVRHLPLISVPTAPAYVLGLVNWRDRSVPVIDLASRLNLASPVDLSMNGQIRLMVARGHDRSSYVSFPVQPGVRLLRLPVPHQPSTRPLELDQRFIHGMVELENETLVIPDIEGLLKLES